MTTRLGRSQSLALTAMPIACALLLGAAVQRTAAEDLTNLTVAVSFTNDGKVVVDGKAMEVARLPKKLKSMGATGSTVITIGIPEDTSPQTLMTLSRALTAAGLTKILFVKPRQVTATVDGAAPSSGNGSVTYGPGSRSKRTTRR